MEESKTKEPSRHKQLGTTFALENCWSQPTKERIENGGRVYRRSAAERTNAEVVKAGGVLNLQRALKLHHSPILALTAAASHWYLHL